MCVCVVKVVEVWYMVSVYGVYTVSVCGPYGGCVCSVCVFMVSVCSVLMLCGVCVV